MFLVFRIVTEFDGQKAIGVSETLNHALNDIRANGQMLAAPRVDLCRLVGRQQSCLSQGIDPDGIEERKLTRQAPCSARYSAQLPCGGQLQAAKQINQV